MLEDEFMIADFDDFVTWMYWIVDDMWQRLAPFFTRPGPTPICSDSELLTMAIVGQCRGWDVETELVSHWHERRDLFPEVPERSRFNRRLRNLMPALNLIRHLVIQLLDVAQDRQCAIDSVPVPVVQFHLAPTASRQWAVHGATFGKVVTKKQTIFGYKLHLLVTLHGVIIDFVLAPAHAADLTLGEELLRAHTDLVVLGDKGYISQPLATSLAQDNRLQLLTIPRRNEKRHLPAAIARLFNAQRQIIETVHDQLTEQFHIATNHAHSFWGLCTRLYTKLTAHTLSVYLNRLLGTPAFLQIKQLAFPN
jgi:transposase